MDEEEEEDAAEEEDVEEADQGDELFKPLVLPVCTGLFCFSFGNIDFLLYIKQFF